MRGQTIYYITDTQAPHDQPWLIDDLQQEGSSRVHLITPIIIPANLPIMPRVCNGVLWSETELIAVTVCA